MSYIQIREVPADEVSVKDMDGTSRTFETDSEALTAAWNLINLLDNLDDETVIVITKVVM